MKVVPDITIEENVFISTMDLLSLVKQTKKMKSSSLLMQGIKWSIKVVLAIFKSY
jgi:hypothetical protein